MGSVYRQGGGSGRSETGQAGSRALRIADPFLFECAAESGCATGSRGKQADGHFARLERGFEDGSQPVQMATLSSWPDDASRRYYSGRATYRKTIDVSAAAVGAGQSVAIDFGEGTPVPLPTMPAEFNMRAYLESPVREAAEVYVNDQLAGYVWHPPFRVDLTPYVKAGQERASNRGRQYGDQ